MNDTRRLRPIDQLLVDTWRIIVRQWPAFLAAQGIAFLVTLCAGFALLGPLILGVIDYFIRLAPTFRATPSHAGFQAVWAHLAPAFAVVGGIVIPAIVVFTIVGQIVKLWGHAALIGGMAHGSQRRADPWQCCRRAVRKTMPLFWLGLVVWCIVFAGFLLLIVPGIICAIALSQVCYLRVLEDRPLGDCLRCSWDRTRGHRMAIFGRYCLLMLVVFALLMAGTILQVFPILALLGFVINVGLQCTMPVAFLVMGYLMYLDLRPRALL